VSAETRNTPGRSPRVLAWALLAIILLPAMLVADGAVLAAGPARVVSEAPAKTRTIALTFDDGWQPGRCGEIFETLKRFDVPATWFPNAVYMGAAPGLWRRIAERHSIGNHTTHHLSLPGRPAREVRKEIRSAERRIEKLTGRPMSKLLRPPYGAWDQRLRREAGRLGYDTIVLWDVSANDTSPRATERGVARAALRGKPGSIVLMHCGPEVTPRVLPVVIARYACDGFRFATVEGLLAGEPGVEAKVTCPPPKLPQRPVSARTEEADVGPYGQDLGAEAAGGEWQLTDIMDGDVLGPVPADVVFTLRFEPGKVSGVVGCDVYTARSPSRPDGALELSRLMRSFDGCDVGADSSASPLDLLMSTASQRIVDDVLELLDADGRTLLRFAPSEPSGLVGDWIVSAVADDSGALLATEGGPPITATFASNGSLSGSTGCSAYRGGYSTFGSAVSAGPLLAAAAACEDDPAGAGARFLQALRSVTSWSLGVGVLELRDARDAVVLELLPNTPGA
jgi:peptidoglycan/xylan/chitin deacetylase (PgdA/CDA1 family)